MRSWPVSNCSPPSTHHRRRLHPGGASSVATRTSRAEQAAKCPLPPAVVDPRSPIWPYGPFWNVPQLGSEPVRGSGCGSQGQIGDVIPDGLWAGYVTNETTPAVEHRPAVHLHRRGGRACRQRGHRDDRQRRAGLPRRQQQHPQTIDAGGAWDRAARRRRQRRRVRRGCRRARTTRTRHGRRGSASTAVR